MMMSGILMTSRESFYALADLRICGEAENFLSDWSAVPNFQSWGALMWQAKVLSAHSASSFSGKLVSGSNVKCNLFSDPLFERKNTPCG
jgi:hypothetical protein